MRVLYVSPNSPALPRTGSEQRSSLILDALARVAEVDIAIVAWEEVVPQQIAALRERCAAVYVLDPYQVRCLRQKIVGKLKAGFSLAAGRHHTQVNRNLHVMIKKLMERECYDFIVVRYLDTARYVNALAFPNVVVDVDDVPAESYWTSAVCKAKNRLQKYFRIYKWHCVRREAEHDIAKCLHVWLANRDHVAWPNSSHLPNIPFFLGQQAESGQSPKIPHGTETEQIVLFVGLMAYQPNVDAMDFLVGSVWPQVIAAIPSAKLRIAGKNPRPESLANWSGAPNVSVLGFVEDLPAEYARARVVVAPIFSGSGTNIKVIEAMAYGKPCVVSTFAGKGFEHFLRDGKNIVLADDADAFARQTISLLANVRLAEGIGREAAGAIQANFDIAQVNETVAADLNRLCAASTKDRKP